jgi:hypothetical protein
MRIIREAQVLSWTESMNYRRGDRQVLTTDLEKKEQWIRDTKAEEDRIRDMKKSRDYRKWASLSK